MAGVKRCSPARAGPALLAQEAVAVHQAAGALASVGRNPNQIARALNAGDNVELEDFEITLEALRERVAVVGGRIGRCLWRMPGETARPGAPCRTNPIKVGALSRPASDDLCAGYFGAAGVVGGDAAGAGIGVTVEVASGAGVIAGAAAAVAVGAILASASVLPVTM